MEVYRIDWVDINGNVRNAAAWFYQLKDLVKILLDNKEIVTVTIFDSVGEVIFKVTEDGVVIDEFDIMNKLDE